MTVASAYGSLASNGVHCTPIPIQSILGADGKELPFDKPGAKNCQQVVDPEVAHGVANIMTSVLSPGGTGSASKLNGGRIAAGKTGTTDKNNETWFVGYTPQLAAAVDFYKGTGRADLDGVGGLSTFFGGEYPARIWTAFMTAAMQNLPVKDFPPPAYVGVAVNPQPTSTPTPTTSSPTPTTSAPTILPTTPIPTTSLPGPPSTPPGQSTGPPTITLSPGTG